MPNCRKICINARPNDSGRDKARNAKEMIDMSDYQTGVLLVHGIQGSPKQLHFLTEALPRNTIVSNLLLPGHGAGVSQFRHSGQEQWLLAVVDAAQKLRIKCNKVIFVGHSMGCLLGLLAEKENPGLFSDMILLCCPFSLHLTFRYLKNNILSFKKDPSDPYVLATKEANSVSAKNPLAYFFCVHPYLELLRMIHSVGRMKLPSVSVKYFFADHDEIVSPHSVAIADAHKTNSTHILTDCGHHYFTDEAKKKIKDVLLTSCT